MNKQQFQQVVWQYYETYGRHDLPWRLPEADGSFDPYKILVSEIMLQQTQVPRVIPKYLAFLETFPTIESLAVAPLSSVLKLWSGLGYNRRAKFLLRAAQTIMQDFDGQFPQAKQQLVKLPGVGANTAGAIMAYAFNLPVVFIETNVRTVYIHHFFADHTAVADTAVAAVVAETMSHDRAREWYWALMDYGSYLKQSVGNKSRSSTSYVKQSAFVGSTRQLRGAVIRELLERPLTLPELHVLLADDRLPMVLASLVQEGLVEDNQGHFSIT